MISYRRFALVFTGLFVGCALLFAAFSSAVYALGTLFNWQSLSTTTSPGPNWLYGLSYDSGRGVTVLFGGADVNGVVSGDTWEWNGSVWTQLGTKRVGTGAVGNAQQGHSVFLSADGNTAIIGGPFDNSSAGAAWVFAVASSAP